MLKKLVLMFSASCCIAFVAKSEQLGFKFETWGDDCYEDGTMLEEGECYALVWRHNDLASSIEGLFDNSGKPVDSEKCEILGVFDAAVHDVWGGEEYACASTSWVILPEGHYSTKSSQGVYSVFVFDTRTWDGEKWTVGSKTGDKSVSSLRRYGLVSDLEDIKLLNAGDDEESFATFFHVLPKPGETIEEFVARSFTSTGDNEDNSYADESVVCPVSFYIDDETFSEKKMLVIDEPIGELPTPAERVGFRFLGWFTDGGESVTPDTVVTSGMKLTAKWEAVYVPEPVFSSLAITNNTAYLSVTNTVPSQKYGVSWVTDILKVFSTTNWVDGEQSGSDSVDTPIKWEIDVSGKPQGFFRVLRK